MNLIIPNGSWKDLEEDLLGPACDRDGFQTSQSWLGHMWEYFRMSGFDFKKTVRVLKDPEIEKYVRSMVDTSIDGKWLFSTFTDMYKMEAIKTALPIVYSLTTKRKACTTTTGTIIELYKQPWRKDEESIVQHEAVGGMESLKSCGLLIWENVGAMVPGSVKFSAIFDSILEPHTKNGKSVFFFLPCRKGRFGQEKLLEIIAAAIGDTATVYVENYAKFLNVGES